MRQVRWGNRIATDEEGGRDGAPTRPRETARTTVEILITRALMLLISIYRVLISPLIGPSCRFTPSCSHFAHTALRKHGLRGGGRLAIGRLLRCHPWRPGGFDPVP